MKYKIKCPYCNSEDSQGTTGIHLALNDVNWDAEQAFACLNPKCHKEFVAVYVLKHGTITIEQSTVFEEE